jgi:membrane-anchored protein YejM (alkaline phosphatase superfamily)
LLNVGETHYPYALPDEDPAEWPRISGVHGTLKDLDVATAGRALPGSFFDQDRLEMLRNRQVRAAQYIDELFTRVFDIVPANTWLIVTSDHGELFGEEGYFGHGPIMHEKVFEVPFVEGLRP